MKANSRMMIRAALFLVFAGLLATPAPGQSEADLQKARRLRADAGYLELKGELEAAAKRYEESYSVVPDPAILEKIKKLRGQRPPGVEDLASVEAAPSRLCPGPFEVKVTKAPDNARAGGVLVQLAGRQAFTDPGGSAIFDGVPAGKHSLRVLAPGFNRLMTEVELPAGKREAKSLQLLPEVRAKEAKGTVVLSDLKTAVIGARIRLEPVKVAAVSQGPVEFMSDTNGAFLINQLPVGTYQATLRAAGCREMATPVEVNREGTSLVFRMERVLEDASLTLRAVNALTGAPVVGADIILAEAHPLGEIARATTDTSGAARFARLNLAQVNWLDEAGKCAASRRHITVHASAAGFVPATDPVSLGVNATAEIRLHPVRDVPEAEPNNAIAAAQEVDLGAVVKFSITKNDDLDWFKVRVPHNGWFQATVGADSPLETYMWMYNSEGQCIAQSGAGVGAANRIALHLAAGEYRVQIGEWGANAASAAVLTLGFEYTPAPDPMAPNDTRDTARLIRVNEEVRGYIHPVGDTDHYRFTMTRPGGIRVRVSPATYERYLWVFNSRGEPVVQGGGGQNQGVDLYVHLPAGEYVIGVAEWGNNDCGLDPYALRLEQIEDDLADDTFPKRPPAWGRPLEINTLAGNTIHPTGDVDYYMVALPGPGVFYASAVSGNELYLHILSAKGDSLAQAGSGPTATLTTEYHANGPEVVYLEVREWGDNDSSPSPYLVWTSFLPADETDTMARNDRPDNATPFLPGDALRGTILPYQDVEYHVFNVDRPGWFDGYLTAHTEIYIRLLSPKMECIAQWGYGAVKDQPFSHPLTPGDYFLEISEWGNNGWSTAPYELRTAFRRADPDEPAVLAASAPVALEMNRVHPFKIEHTGDLERFSAAVPAEGTFELVTAAPLERYVIVRDALTGAILFQYGIGPGTHRHPFTVKGPTRLDIEVTEWGNNGCSMEDFHILLTEPGRAIVAENLVARVDRTDPARVFFRRAETAHARAARAMLDADGDGKADLEVPETAEVEYRFKQQGVYNAQLLLEGAGGIRGSARTWVEAVGYHERKGVHLIVSAPLPDETLETGKPVRAAAISYTGAKINRVEVTLDGTYVGSTHAAPFEIPVPWDNLGPGAHTLKITATDAKGTQAVVERRVKVSEFFDLFPSDGAQCTGEGIAVSWRGRTFGQSAVRVRKAGGKEWTRTVQGPSGRARRIQVRDLEPGVAYEIQPVGAAEGPVRTVTRVKGLAFGRTTYAAAIKRDYDQRVGVSVRNHGEKPLTLKLECAPPPAESLLLAGFVGEGSEGAPFDLAPGEEREFWLGISAQDCVWPKVAFPIRISSATGAADEAMVEVEVKLPNVALEWEDKGELPGGIGRLLMLHNKGDTLTDLAVGSVSTDMGIRPTVSHGMLPAGQSMPFQVVPRLYEGFKSAEGVIQARAVNKASDLAQKVALKEGQSIHKVDLGPRSTDPVENEIQRERALAAAYLNPADVDWSKKTRPLDTDGDGRIDQWQVDIPWESTRWIGRDTDGDGEIDFTEGDVGMDGRSDYAAMKGRENKWEETNLVGATLEMGFSLPYARNAYEPHDANIVFNGRVVGNLKDTIPEGNYAFKVPPSAFLFNEDGSPATNEVRIQSKHLRGGHYVVTSNFSLKTNLTGTRVYTAAKSAGEAAAAVRATPGLVLDAPDLSVSSAEMRVEGQPKGGAPLTVRVPVRNLGSGAAKQVTVALAFSAGGEDIELARTAIASIPANGQAVAEITAPAPAGEVVLKVLVDPDRTAGDAEPANNESRAPFKADGDKEKPVLTVQSPADGASLKSAVADILCEAGDNEGVARVEVSVERGLWKPLARTASGHAGKALLQPGARELKLRARDNSGNVAEQVVKVTVPGQAPEVRIVEPAAGAELARDMVPVRLQCGGGAGLAAIRVNGGTWRQGRVKDGVAVIPAPLPFGEVRIEAMVVDENGARGTASCQVTCTQQATAEAPAPAGGAAETAAAGEKPDGLNVKGFGPVDPFAEGSPVAAGDAPPGGGAAPATGGAGGGAPENGLAAPMDNGAEMNPAPDIEGENGNYGSAPPEEGYEPPTPEELAAAEAALDEEGEDVLAPEEWLNDAESAPDPSELDFQPEPDDPNYQMPDMESWDEMPQPDTPENPEPVPPEGPAGGGGGFQGDAGGYVGVQQKQSDWYCTNRPEVGVKFNMPDWMKKLNVPKPGTKEFEEMFQKRIAALKAQGMDTSQLEKIRSILQARCKRLDSPEQLPGFLESLGFNFGYKPKGNPAELAEWREKMGNAADSFMLRLLHSNNPALIAQGLRARMDALGQFDAAAKESAEAALETVTANQKITEEVAMAVPYLNVALSVHNLYTGEKLTGEKMGKLDTVFSVLTVAGPAYQLFKNPSLRQAAASIGNKAMWAGQKGITTLAGKLGIPPDKLRGVMDRIANTLGNARISAGERLYGKAWAAGERFANSPAGRQAAARAAKDVKQAEALLHRIAQARAGGDKKLYRDLICKLQGNKTAQGLLNTGKYSNEFRNALDKTHRAMGKLADKRTIAEFMKSPEGIRQMKEAAAKAGVKVEDLVIRARNISGNTKTLASVKKTGEMLKYGADRDVVFQFCVKGKHQGWRAVRDVHHGHIGKLYSKNLQRITGRSAGKMDHVVTSRWNPEAYNSGLNPNTAAGREAIADIISGKAAGKLGRPSDIRDTIIHKGNEWMEAGHELAKRGAASGDDALIALGNQKIREGMRQMGKEYNRQVAQFLQAKGLDAAKALPPRLRQGLEIFKKVEQGMPVEQGMEMLKALTPKGGIPVTPQSIATDLGYYVEFVNRWGLKAAQ